MKTLCIIFLVIFCISLILFIVNISFWGFYSWQWEKVMKLGNLSFEWSDKTWQPLTNAMICLIIIHLSGGIARIIAGKVGD